MLFRSSIPAAGTRYLLTQDYIVPAGEQPSYNWVGSDGEPLSAYANDIIEYSDGEWIVARSHQSLTTDIVTNSYTMKKYEWVPPAPNDNQWIQGKWVDIYQGLYGSGHWAVYL